MDSSGDSYQMTYDSFVSNSEEIEEYLGGELKEENTIAIIENNTGVIQRVIAKALNENSVGIEDQFYAFLNSEGAIILSGIFT